MKRLNNILSTAAFFLLIGLSLLISCNGRPSAKQAATIALPQKETVFQDADMSPIDTGLDWVESTAKYELQDLVPPGEVVYRADAHRANLYDLDITDIDGEAWVTGFGKSDSVVIWRFIPEETRFYSLVLEYDPGTDSKEEAELLLNGHKLATLKATGKAGMLTLELPSILMNDEVQEFALWTGWETLKIGKFTLTSEKTVNKHKPHYRPVNPNASAEVQRVLAFLASVWGKHILSGQMDVAWSEGIDMLAKVKKDTGREPAIMGYDFLQITGPVRNFGQTKEAIDYWNRGGLITFCWHWRMGRSREFYTDRTDFRINRDESSKEYEDSIKMIDIVAGELKKLQDLNIPVLWRPLHEASGGWFWWGASGPEDYLWLWDLLYDRLTNYHGLNNLIWVWNGQDENWYPGDETVDIIGMDIYPPPGDHESQLNKFMQASSWAKTSHKLVALSENGSIPDPDRMIEDGAAWAYFMTWNDGASRDDKDNFWSGKLHNDLEFRKKVYNHPYVLTLDELPSFK